MGNLCVTNKCIICSVQEGFIIGGCTSPKQLLSHYYTNLERRLLCIGLTLKSLYGNTINYHSRRCQQGSVCVQQLLGSTTAIKTGATRTPP